MLQENELKAIVASIPAPFTKHTLGDFNAVKTLALGPGGVVTVHVVIGYPVRSAETLLTDAIKNKLLELDGITSVSVVVDVKIIAHKVPQGTRLLKSVKNVIAIASGKGGVGKSATAVNLALALQAEGARVGIFDADIHGPSLPLMLGIPAESAPPSPDGKQFPPVDAHGLQLMSMGLLVDEDTPMIWRGPMASQVFEQLVSGTQWEKLDYLIIDMPPGTGDVQLTLAQRLPLTACAIVTTPQSAARLDASRCIAMFEKLKLPVLGVIENMSRFVCPHCGESTAIFGERGAKELCERHNIPLLNSIPWSADINGALETGTPEILLDDPLESSQKYLETARKIAVEIARLPKDTTGGFPKIVVENASGSCNMPKGTVGSTD